MYAFHVGTSLLLGFPVRANVVHVKLSLSASACFNDLPRYAAETGPAPSTGERNFLPFIAWMATRATVVTCPCTDPREAIGVNTPEDLAAVAAYLASR